MIKKAIVTGGTGVTGNALVRLLLQQNIKVTALVRPESSRRRFLPQNHNLLRVIECGLEDYQYINIELLKEEKYDVFFHLAWEGSTGKQKVNNRNNFKLQNQNVLYALDAVELCHKLGCGVFVMTGSQAEYGRKEGPIKEEMNKNPENGYGIAKLCAEGMTRLLCREYGIRHIWPILFSIYGPCDFTESLIDTSIRELLKGNTLPYTGGEQIWDYLYSFDAANALLLLAEKGEDGETYHVASGESHPLKRFIDIMYNVVAPDIQPRLGEIPYSANQIMYLGADISKLKRVTGFSPQYKFAEGILEIRNSIIEESRQLV